MKKILIIGAGFLQDFVIKRAKEMGYFTLAVDADPDAVGFEHADKYAVINIVDEESCLQFARKEQIDGVLTAATDYGVLTASYIANKMGIPGLNYESAKMIKNKYLVRKCLYENRVDDTKQTFEVDGNTDVDMLARDLSYPVMVKPCDGSGSRGASRVNYSNELKKACKYAMEGSLTHRAEIESFIIGEEYGAESLVVDGEIHVLAIMKKWMTLPPYYAELGHAIPCGLSKKLQSKVTKCVEKAIQALGINHGSVNMDILITEEETVHIIDVGARMGGNMIGPCVIPYGTGIDYMGNMLKAAVGDKLDWTIKEHGAVATRLLAFKGGVISRTPSIDELRRQYGVEIYHHMQEGELVNEYHTNLDGYGYIVSCEKTQEESVEKANEALEYIKRNCFCEERMDKVNQIIVEERFYKTRERKGYKGIYQCLIKRIVDIIVSLMALPIFLLIMIPVAILIKLDDGGTVFYRSKRLGVGFKEFDMFKFRTMKENAPDLRNKDGSTYNSEEDPRLTRVGRILRETSIDEIPQVLNILKGDMSIIGPRPGDVESKDTYEQDEKEKLLIRPGITGYTQAYYRNNIGVREKRLYDAWYAHNVSLILDIKIFFMTIKTVLKKENIYTN